MDITDEENKSSLVKARDGIPTPKEFRKVLDAAMCQLPSSWRLFTITAQPTANSSLAGERLAQGATKVMAFFEALAPCFIGMDALPQRTIGPSAIRIGSTGGCVSPPNLIYTTDPIGALAFDPQTAAGSMVPCDSNVGSARLAIILRAKSSVSPHMHRNGSALAQHRPVTQQRR
jgi:hypothetical protein